MDELFTSLPWRLYTLVSQPSEQRCFAFGFEDVGLHVMWTDAFGRIMRVWPSPPWTWPALGIYREVKLNSFIQEDWRGLTLRGTPSLTSTLLLYGAYTQLCRSLQSNVCLSWCDVQLCNDSRKVVEREMTYRWFGGHWDDGSGIPGWIYQLWPVLSPETIIKDPTGPTQDLWCDSFCESLINSGALVDNDTWPRAQEAVY